MIQKNIGPFETRFKTDRQVRILNTQKIEEKYTSCKNISLGLEERKTLGKTELCQTWITLQQILNLAKH